MECDAWFRLKSAEQDRQTQGLKVQDNCTEYRVSRREAYRRPRISDTYSSFFFMPGRKSELWLTVDRWTSKAHCRSESEARKSAPRAEKIQNRRD